MSLSVDEDPSLAPCGRVALEAGLAGGPPSAALMVPTDGECVAAWRWHRSVQFFDANPGNLLCF